MKEKIETIKQSDIKKIQDNMKLDKCVTAPHPEMIRNTNKDEPCDDARA